MELDLRNKSCCIYGLPDSGKSTITNYILTRYGTGAIIYDSMREYQDSPYDRYVPAQRYSVAELSNFIRAIFKSQRYKIVAIDEANRFCPSKPAPLPQAVADLNDFRAHYGIGTIFICRRPVQLNQDLTEMAHYLIILRLPGKNDIAYLNDIAGGLGDAVSRLPKFHFILVNPDRTYRQLSPVPPEFKTNKGKHLTK